jgi:tRNA modification GTPase
MDELRTKMRAARESALLDADLIVEVVDAPGEAGSGEDYGAARVTVWNKADLYGGVVAGAAGWQVVSTKTGQGIGELRAALRARVARCGGGQTAGASRLVLNHRHRALLQEAGPRLHAAGLLAEAAARQPELLAAELRQALDLLGRITGRISPDEVLGRIFSQFCIGK